MAPLAEVSLLAVFLVGLLGGAHCTVMCGPIVTALNLAGESAQPPTRPPAKQIPIASVNPDATANASARRPGKPFLTRLAYNLGRISIYTLLGALVGGLGAGAWLVDRWLPVQQLVLLFTSLTLLVLGLYLLRVPAVTVAIERAGQRVWRLVQPLARKRLFGHGVLNAYAAGALWGLVPCGMVYGALAMALVSGTVTSGAMLMAAFGLGTLPNLLLVGAFGARIGRRLFHPVASRIAGATIVGFGLFGLMRMTMSGSMLAPVMQ